MKETTIRNSCLTLFIPLEKSGMVNAIWRSLFSLICLLQLAINKALSPMIACAMLSRNPSYTMLPRFELSLCSISNNLYEENNLYNFVSIMLEQHCIGISSSQYCLNAFEKTFHKKITCAMLAQSSQSSFRHKTTNTILTWSDWVNITLENYLCSISPKSANSFVQKNNL